MTSMSLNTEVGSFVIFTGVGGYPNENDRARERLSVGGLYEVLSMKVGGWSSAVTLQEGSFNTVMFVNATTPPEEMPDDNRKSYGGLV
jgi:hypothetical protein